MFSLQLRHRMHNLQQRVYLFSRHLWMWCGNLSERKHLPALLGGHAWVYHLHLILFMPDMRQCEFLPARQRSQQLQLLLRLLLRPHTAQVQSLLGDVRLPLVPQQHHLSCLQCLYQPRRRPGQPQLHVRCRFLFQRQHLSPLLQHHPNVQLMYIVNRMHALCGSLGRSGRTMRMWHRHLR